MNAQPFELHFDRDRHTVSMSIDELARFAVELATYGVDASILFVGDGGLLVTLKQSSGTT